MTAVTLSAFSARRLVLLGAALAPRRREPGPAAELPTVTLVVPARDEGAAVERTLESIARLDYPPKVGPSTGILPL
jgi:cellulose synthase/poly-beta-1,6-N-acetylglucosamine synthase-like glycosyltransferase